MVASTKLRKVTDDFEKMLLSRWTKRILNKQHFTLYDLVDLNPNHILKIVEILLNKKLPLPDALKASIDSDTNFEKNLSSVFGIIQNESLNEIDFPPPEKVSTEKTLIYDVLYQLFHHFQRFSEGNDENAEESLLHWVRSRLTSKTYKDVKVDDFGKSWRNGVALCSLIHQYNPRCLKFEKLRSFDADANIRLSIYASNVLFNFDDLFTYQNYVDASKPAMVLLVAEFFYAIKNSPKIPFATEVITEIARNLQNYKKTKTAVSIKEKEVERGIEEKTAKLDGLARNILKGVDVSPQDATRLSGELVTLRKTVFALETKRFEKFLGALEINSLKYLSRVQKEIENSDCFSRLNELKERCLEIENKSFYRHSNAGELDITDKKHAELSDQLIKWTEEMRKRLSSKCSSTDLQGVINEINCHMALNININSNRNFFREELNKLEIFLNENNYAENEKINDRVSLEPMFGVIAKEWLKKLGELRETKSKIECDLQINVLCEQYQNLFHAIERREEEFFYTFCRESTAKDLLEAKRKMYRLNYEKITNSKMNESTFEKMASVEKQIKFLTNQSLTFLKFDDSFFRKFDKKIRDLESKSEERFKKARDQLTNLMARELYKEKICVMAEAHKDMAEGLIDWVREKKIMLASIGSESNRIDRVLGDLTAAKNCKTDLEHEMELKILYLKKVGAKITTSDFTSGEFPEHRWRYINGTEDDYSFRTQREKVVVAFAELATLCDEKQKMLKKKLEEYKKRDDLRIKFSSVVEQFKQFIEQRAKQARACYLSPKHTDSEVEQILRQFEQDEISAKSGAASLLSDAEKKFQVCREAGAANDLSDDILENIHQMHDDFVLLLKVTKERLSREADAFWEKVQLCKEYAAKTKEAIEQIRVDFIETVKQHSLQPKQNQKMLRRAQKKIDAAENAEAEISSLENVLFEKEISFNPYTADQLEDIKGWTQFLKSCLLSEKRRLEKFETCRKLNRLPVFEAENLHRNYSKHFDSRKNAYMNQESFVRCMEDLKITFDQSEVEAIFDKLGTRSKKKPNTKLISFKNFSDFVYNVGSSRYPWKVFESFSALNNGLCYIYRGQLATKMPLEDLTCLEKAVRSASSPNAPPHTNRLFFGDWVKETFPPIENGLDSEEEFARNGFASGDEENGSSVDAIIERE